MSLSNALARVEIIEIIGPKFKPKGRENREGITQNDNFIYVY